MPYAIAMAVILALSITYTILMLPNDWNCIVCFTEQTSMLTLSHCVRIMSLTNATASFLKIQARRGVESCVWTGWCTRSATRVPVPASIAAIIRESRSINGQRDWKSFPPLTEDTEFGRANLYTQVE